MKTKAPRKAARDWIERALAKKPAAQHEHVQPKELALALELTANALDISPADLIDFIRWIEAQQTRPRAKDALKKICRLNR